MNKVKRDSIALGARWSAQNLIRRGEKSMWFGLPATNIPIYKAYNINVPYPSEYTAEIKALKERVMRREDTAIKKARDKLETRFRNNNPSASTTTVTQYLDSNAKRPSRGAYIRWARLARIYTS